MPHPCSTKIGKYTTIFLTDYDGYYEIYGSEFTDGVFHEGLFRELLAASRGECKRLGAKYMTYFCGEDEKAVLSEFGFKCVGQYVLYIYKKAFLPILMIFQPVKRHHD